MTPDSHSFDTLLAPARVAVIGSLSSPDKIGARTVDHLRRAGYRGDVQAVRKVDDLHGEVDVAVVAVPAPAVPDVLAALHGRAAHAVVYSSGFGEAGGQRLSSGHDESPRLLGPNTVGLYVAASATALAFAHALGPIIDDAGRDPAARRPEAAALVTHSGAFGARITSAATKRGLRIGTFIATGNEDGYTIADVLVGVGGSSVVAPRVVLVYLEAVRDGPGLLAAVRSLTERDIEVVVLPGGRSSVGAGAASSHTAALVADADVLAGGLSAAGAIVVDGDRQLLDALAALSLERRVPTRRAAVLTGSGGAGVVAADLLAAHGLSLPPLSATTREQLDALLPDFAATANPIDVTAAAIADDGLLTTCAELLATSGEVDVLVTVARSSQVATLRRAASPLPVIAALLDATTHDLRELASSGLLAAGDLTSAATMAAALTAAPPDDEAVTTMPAVAPSETRLAAPPTASESLRLVAGHGITTARWRHVATAEDACRAGAELGWPVVVKADLPAHVHKRDAGGVQLDVTAEQLPTVAADLLATAPAGLIVAAQRRGSIELFAGARADPQFGVVVVAGLGGSHVELLARTVSAPATVSARWLAGRIDDAVFRGRGPSGTAARLANAATALADLVRDTGAGAAECNPLIDTAEGLVALDARVVLP